MILYHGSNTGNMKVLKPNQADHDRPYVYMTTMDVVAAFYLCNAVERPWYWFPYGFETGSDIPVYHELYPNALREVSEGVSGYIYKVYAEENQVIPFKNIPCARLAAEPVEVTECIRVEDAYALFMEYVKQGRMKVGRFEDKSQNQLDWWYACCIGYLKEKQMIKTPDCSYATFLKSKLPGVWERYIAQCNPGRESCMETKDLTLRILKEESERLRRLCIDIRIMNYDDIPLICRADGDGSQKNTGYLKRQLDNQKKSECTALLALYNGAVAGYVFLYHKCRWGGLAGQNIPGVVDLIVFEKYRQKKIATMLLDVAENIAKQHCNKIYLDVCLNSEYGPAQRFYIKRGYIPDGKGVYYKEKICETDAVCRNDDELTLCLVKEL